MKRNISKVMLEEKLLETWHYARVVLMGDGKKSSFTFEEEERSVCFSV